MATPTAQQWDKIARCLQAMWRRSSSPQMALVDPIYALDQLRNHLPHEAHDGFFLVYEVGSPWYSYEKVLFEELVLRFDDSVEGAPGAVRRLEELAKEHGCAAIASGDTQVRAMSPHYVAAGFTPIGDQFFKELQHGETT